jgi:hypothetical protein
MEKLFNGEIIILSNTDVSPRGIENDELFIDSIKGSIVPIRNASYVLYFNEERRTMKIIKERQPIKIL